MTMIKVEFMFGDEIIKKTELAHASLIYNLHKINDKMYHVTKVINEWRNKTKTLYIQKYNAETHTVDYVPEQMEYEELVVIVILDEY